MIKIATVYLCDKCGLHCEDLMSDEWKPLLDDLGCPRCRTYALTRIAHGVKPETYPPNGISKFYSTKISLDKISRMLNGTHS
jgi:hypothetical protein